MALGMNGLKKDTFGEDYPIQKKPQRKRANPYDTLVDVIQIIVEYGYDDGAISDEEFELSIHRLKNALEYIIVRKVEEVIDEKKQV